MEPVICPSCGSKYNPETRELVEDTGLLARIRELEADAQTLRDASEAQLTILNAPKPKARDFIVGQR